MKEIRRRVGIVFQDPDDQLFMPTVRDDVAFGPANLGVRGEELERAGRCSARRGRHGASSPIARPTTCRFGQRRRVAVATVLAMQPEILVLDEPSSNLDPAGRRELADILRSLDITMLMVTHDLPYALGALSPGRDERRADRGRRPTAEILGRRRADVGEPARAAVRVLPGAGGGGAGRPRGAPRLSPPSSRRPRRARDREMRQVGLEAVMAPDQLLERLGLRE